MTETPQTGSNSLWDIEIPKQDSASNPAAPAQPPENQADAQAEPTSAGGLLKRLREQAGWSIESLAGALKVPGKTLLALEADDMTHLPDLVFSRALAASVCRTLKADAKPVLALMPQLIRRADVVKPEASLNVPMGRAVDFLGPVAWLKTSTTAWVVVILLAIVVVANWPSLSAWWGKSDSKAVEPATAAAQPAEARADSHAVQVQPAASGAAAQVPAGVKTLVSEVIPVTQSSPGASGGVGAGAPPVAQLAVTVQATTPSWVEVTDNGGKSLWKRLVDHGEPVQLMVPGGTRLVVGNAAATRVTVNGKNVDLSAVTNANVARLELQ